MGSLDQQHQLGTCWKFEFSGLTLELLYYVLLCGCQSGVAIGRDTGDTQGNTFIILAASRNRKLASQGGSHEKAQSGGRRRRREGAAQPLLGLLWGKLLAMVFSLLMCGYESWTVKKAERRSDAFELWCWRRLLRVPWTARRSNQSILKEISPEHLLEGLMLKLKLQYFGHLM